MTPTQGKTLREWVRIILATILIPFGIWAFKTYDSGLIHRAEYDLTRQRDSTQLERISRRSLITLCRVAPEDSECSR
jgi:hypothetical protein